MIALISSFTGGSPLSRNEITCFKYSKTIFDLQTMIRVISISFSLPALRFICLSKSRRVLKIMKVHLIFLHFSFTQMNSN